MHSLFDIAHITGAPFYLPPTRMGGVMGNGGITCAVAAY